LGILDFVDPFGQWLFVIRRQVLRPVIPLRGGNRLCARLVFGRGPFARLAGTFAVAGDCGAITARLALALPRLFGAFL